MEGIFYKNVDDYTEQLDPVNDYLKQLTQFVRIKKGCDEAKASEIAKDILKTRFRDKDVKYFGRQENGDRTVENTSLLTYIRERIADKNVIAPTFTTYLNVKHKRSVISDFINDNVKVRAIAKKQSQEAKARGDALIAENKNNEQNNMKIYNNAVSGLFGQKASVLFNPTAHSTLTSLTRTITSLSNTCNERLVAGNRYLPTPSDVYRSVVYESSCCNQDLVKRAVETYGLAIPTVDDIVEMLKWSSDLYFTDHRYYREHIIPFLEGLNPWERCTIYYTSDLYHQKKLNDDFIRGLLSKMVVKFESGEVLEDPSILYSVNPTILNHIHTVYYDEIKGKGKDYGDMNKIGLASALWKTAKHIEKVLEEYKLFFNAFYMTGLTPINSHKIGNMKRRVVVLSDTDSTCFSLDKWVEWYLGKFVINGAGVGIAGAITYIAAENIVNQLAMFSSRINVERDRLRTLAMKNEFLWTVHCPAEISKHYFAYTVFQEGNIFENPEVETKGVHLKNSAVPPSIIKIGSEMIEFILKTVHENKKLNLTKLVQRVIDVEDMIRDSVLRGDSEFLKNSKIKDKTAYAQDEFKSPYQRHQFWIDVFEPKYGKIDEPPYTVSVLPTTVESKTDIANWLEKIEDKDLSERLRIWLDGYNKTSLPTVYLNDTYLVGNGVPDELASVIDIKRIIFNSTLQFRTILETLGLRLNPDLLVKEQFDINEMNNLLKEKIGFKWSRRGSGYECSSKGDKRFSAFFAKLEDGRTIEEVYQVDVKGYPSIKEGKGKPPLRDVNVWEEYLNLWKRWAELNPVLIQELAALAGEKNYLLTDMFASTEINQARALSEILNERL